MSTRDQVPNGDKEGNFGLAALRWLKGWFWDCYVGQNLTDGTNVVTVAQLAVTTAAKYYAESEGISSTTAQTYQSKLILTMTDMPAGTYAIRWSDEVSASADGKCIMNRLMLDDATILTAAEAYCAHASVYYGGHNGIDQFTVAAGTHHIDFDYYIVQAGNTGYIRRARIAVERVS